MEWDINNNQMTCSDGSIKYCGADEECFATQPFDYGKLYDGCRLIGNFMTL